MRNYKFSVSLLLVLTFTACVSKQTDHRAPVATLERYSIENPPHLLKDGRKTEIALGGFSGLVYEGIDSSTGEMLFLTHTDRGPNLTFDGKVVLAIAKFQPEWVRLALNTKTKAVRVTERIPLFANSRVPMTGLPNQSGRDEGAFDTNKNNLGYDTNGIDPEALVRMPDGTYWMGEEYRPSLLHFSPEGRLLERLVPMGGKVKKNRHEVEALPRVFSNRKRNRGFEGLGVQGTKIFAFLQSSIRDNSRVVRVVEYDVAKKALTGEYIYLLENDARDWKIGDVASLSDGTLLVLEQVSKTGEKSARKLYRVNPFRATNLISHSSHSIDTKKNLEELNESQLKDLKIQPIEKTELIDLARIGYDFASKVEGLTVIGKRTIALVNDDDFGLKGENTEIVLVRLSEDIF